MLKLLRILLLPFSYLFEGIIIARNFFYDKNIFKAEKVGVKVFSIGNITVGGTGKTPTVIYLVNLLKKLGQKPGILSRGYGRKSSGYRLVFDGKRFHCDSFECGDEIVLEARACNVPSAVSENRVIGARKLISATGINALVLDDAFQHRKIARDFDIVLLDENFLAQADFLDKQLLPSGILREPFASLNRASVVIINRKFSEAKELPAKIQRLLKDKKVFYAHYETDGFFDVKTLKRYELTDFIGQKSLAVSGIAKPESFFATLESLGVEITEKLIFKDHKNYSNNDVQLIRKKFYSTNAYSVIVTEKDAVKLARFAKELDDIDIYFLRIKIALENEEEFVRMISSII